MAFLHVSHRYREDTSVRVPLSVVSCQHHYIVTRLRFFHRNSATASKVSSPSDPSANSAPINVLPVCEKLLSQKNNTRWGNGSACGASDPRGSHSDGSNS